MAAAACGSIFISLLVEKPVCVLDASRLGLVPCKMRLDPSDRNNFVKLGENPTPKIPML